MYTTPRPAAGAAYGVLNTASPPGTHDRRRDDSISTYPDDASVAARSWLPPPTSQDSDYGSSYAPHGGVYSSPFASGDAGQACAVTTCAVNLSPCGTYGNQQAAVPRIVVQAHVASHAYTTSRGDHPQPSVTSANVKQEVKEEGMNWLGSPSEQDLFSAPPGLGHFSDNDHSLSGYDSSRIYEADYGPYVKTEPTYEAHSSVGFASQYADSSSNFAEDGLIHEYVQGGSAGAGFVPTPYIAKAGSYIRAQLWPYTYYISPSQSPDEGLYERVYYAARIPTPIQNNRSYTLENAMTPVTPAVESPHPPMPTVPSHRNRPVMDYLRHPSDVAANPTQHPPMPTVPSHRNRPVMDYLRHPSDVVANPMQAPVTGNVRKPASESWPSTRSYTLENAMNLVTPAVDLPHPPMPTVPSHRNRPIMDYLRHPEDVAANPTQAPATRNVRKPASKPRPSTVSSRGQPIRRGRGRPKKHPLPTRTSSPPPVNYPYPSLDAQVQLPPGSASVAAYDVQPQRRWRDSLPEPPPELAGASADAQVQVQVQPQPQPHVSLDEVPFPEGAEHPGQQMFKLTSSGTAKEPVKKKPIMACLFCRERKIACGPPTPGSSEHRCNQCSRRDCLCEYPKESRRGMHKRFPRVAKAKEQGEGAEGVTTDASDPSAMNVQMAEAHAPSLSRAAGQSASDGRQGARMKGREGSDSSVGPRKMEAAA